VREKCRRARESGGQLRHVDGLHERRDLERQLAASGLERLEQRVDVTEVRGLVARDADAVVIAAEVEAAIRGSREHLRGAVRVEIDPQRVEVRTGARRMAELGEAGGDQRGEPAHALRDLNEALRPVIDRVHRRHHREQDLRGADVRRRLLAADVLLARLQREAKRDLALRVARHADDAAGNLPAQVVLARQERRVRTTKAHRHAEPLRGADRDVGAELARRGEQREREQIGRHHDDALRGVDAADDRAVIRDGAVGGRVREQRAAHVAGIERPRGWRGDLQVDPERNGARAHHGDRLRVRCGIDPERLARARTRLVRHHHRLGGGGAFIEQRGVRHREPG
jgi:hypothetical protein